MSLKKWNIASRITGNAYCQIISTDKGISHSRSGLMSGGIPLLSIL